MDSFTAEAPVDPSAVTALLNLLQDADYDFVTPTPATHQRVIARAAEAEDLRDVFGWNIPFAPDVVGGPMFAQLQAARLITGCGKLWRSRVRVSKLRGRLYAHSSYPTDHADAVFFGPDSYRFAEMIAREAPLRAAQDVFDIGCGAGVGGLVAADLIPGACVTFADINPHALSIASANAAGTALTGARFVRTAGLAGLGEADVILANPPYMMDDHGRTYRDGGGAHGEAIALDWARQALTHLRPGGVLLLYTGAAIVSGRDPVLSGLSQLPSVHLRYFEIDPDVFGEELDEPAYRRVERIAAVGAVMVRR